MVMLRLRLVGESTLEIAALTPEPLKYTADAPLRFVPVIFAGRMLPCAPVEGRMVAMAGSPGGTARTFRIRLLFLSAIRRLPSESSATATGASS
jgi:hypothetical protein